MRRFFLLFLTTYLLSQAFDSVLRWVLDMGHAAALIYARDVGLVLAIAVGVFLLVSQDRKISLTFWLLWIMALCSVVSLCSGLVVPQILFGIKIWLPFVAGFLAVETGIATDLHRPKAWMALWLVLCLGVVVNYFYRFPWTGLLLQVGDAEVIANREWTAGGVPRLSGFCRSSFDAAAMILVMFIYLMTYVRGFWIGILLVSLSGVAIALTTTKGVMGVFLGCLFLLPILAYQSKGAKPVEWIATGAIQFFAVLGMVVPIVSLRIPFPRLPQGSMEDWLLSSLLDRAWNTWPRAFTLVSDWQLITGRGIGGIGISQGNFEPAAFSPADNLFVYLYVTAGLVGVGLYLFCAFAGGRLSIEYRLHRMAFLLLFSLFGYGFTTNLIENTCLAMIFGGLLSLLQSREGMRHSHTRDVSMPVANWDAAP